MSKNALIVLDVQNCFITAKTKSLPVKIKKHIVSHKYDFVIFSKFINLKDSNFGKKLNWNKCQNSPEIDIVNELSTIAIKNIIFEKNTYSIFKSKKFNDFIIKNKISRLFLCGLDLDACVMASAFEAFDLGLDVKIIEKLCASHTGKNFYNYALRIINNCLQ